MNNMAQAHYYTSTSGQLLNAVTPSDSVDLSTPARGLLVLAAGNIKFNALSSGADGTVTAHTMTSATVGTIIPTIITRIFSTGTTATVAAFY